jgi:hypothetical protein
MEDFERLKRMAMISPHSHVALRYVRGREVDRRASSRGERMAELAAAARKKHRGLFAGMNRAPARDA